MNTNQAAAAYANDPVFKGMVDAIAHAIHELALTPSEARQAATFAAVLVERRRPPRPIEVKEPK